MIMIMIRRKWMALVLIVCFGITATAAARPDVPRRGGILRISDAVATSNLLPWEMLFVTMASVMPALETLVMVDRRGRVHGRLAERWEVARDLSAVTLYLRRGVRFHDGTELNAEVVKWNLDKHMEAGQLPMVKAVRVVDRYAVRLDLREWDNTVFSLLSGPQGLIISPRSFERNGEDWARWNPVGTGPFRVVRYDRETGAVYRRFEGYWDRGKPYLDGIEYPFIRDQETQRAGILAGRLDIANIGARYGYELSQRGYPVFAEWNGMNTLIPDSGNPGSPFADRRVREAVWVALNREAIAQALGYGYQQAAYQAAWPGTDAYVERMEGPRHDPERGRRLLAEAGYPNGFSTKLFAHIAVSAPPELLAIIQQQLAQVGIRAEIERVPPLRFNEAIRRGWTGLMHYPLTLRGNYNEWVGSYWMLLPFSSWRRPALLRQAFEESRRTRVPEPVKLKRLNRILVQDFDLIPIVHSKSVYVHQPYVRDTGHLKWHNFVLWNPESAWLAR
jgi:peptide/nickel transport system substrate-binding protein